MGGSAGSLLVFALIAAPHSTAEPSAVQSSGVQSSGVQPAGVQRAVLALIVNGAARGDAQVLLEGQHVWVSVETLRGLDLTPPENLESLRTVAGGSYAPLASFAPDIAYEFDEVRLELTLHIAPALLGRSQITLGSPQPSDLVYRSDASAYVNYAMTGGPSTSLGIAADVGLSLRGALLTTTLSNSATLGWRRGLTTLVMDNRSRMTRWTFGDRFGQSGMLGGGVLLGGVSFTREFSINPYFVRFPTAGLSGAVSTASTVDVYVNDHLVARQDLLPGEFELRGVTLPHGSGSTRYLVRDAFGREQQYSNDFYAPQSTLAKGLHEFDYQLGARRINGGYGPLAALGRHRVGLSDTVTGGLRFEADRQLVNGGAEISAGLAKGEVGVTASASRGNGSSGAAALLTYAYSTETFTVAGAITATSAGYRTLSAGLAEGAGAQVQGSAAASLGLGAKVSVSVRETWGQDSRGRWRQDEVTAAKTVSSILTLLGSARMGGPMRGRSLGISASVPLGRSTSATASVDVGKGGYGPRVDVQRSPPTSTGVGYRVYSQGDMVGAAGQYNLRFGRYEARQDLVDGRPTTTFSAAGSLVAIGGGVHAARPVQGAFALVRVPQAAGVRVYLNNQVAGRTNRQGVFLVSDLLPYYGNRLRTAEEDMDLQRSAGRGEQTVSAPPGGGAIVDFGGEQVRPFTGTVRVSQGIAMLTPAFGDMSLTVDGKKIVSPLGRNGEFYFENLPPGRHIATVLSGRLACTLTIVVPADDTAAAREWRCSAAAFAEAQTPEGPIHVPPQRPKK